jgi:hypothetical protein
MSLDCYNYTYTVFQWNEHIQNKCKKKNVRKNNNK